MSAGSQGRTAYHVPVSDWWEDDSDDDLPETVLDPPSWADTGRNDRTDVGRGATDEYAPADRQPNHDHPSAGTGPRGRASRPAPVPIDPVDWSSPFARLALTHAGSVAGDTFVAIALANSLFFSVDPSQSRVKLLLYLLFTMAPFAVVGPILGPAMDRMVGGHRWVAIVSIAGRSVLAVAMMRLTDGGLALFPLAFLSLVMGKTYAVAKSALVPGVVESDSELVEANSKLQLLSGLAGFAAGVPAALLGLAGSSWVLGAGGVVFAFTVLAALRLPAGAAAPTEGGAVVRDAEERALVRVASAGMSWLRVSVGLVTFLLAFALRTPRPNPPLGMSAGWSAARRDGTVTDYLMTVGVHYPTWYFGVIVGCSVLGGLVGSAVAPRIRRVVAEDQILLGCLGLAFLAGLCGVVLSGLLGMVLLAFGIAAAAGIGKQAFDALVQAGSPDRPRGELFAKYETRFQVVWVVGALLPVSVKLPVSVGSMLIVVGSAAAIATYWGGWRRSHGHSAVLATANAIGGGRTSLISRGLGARLTRKTGWEAEPAPKGPKPAGRQRGSRPGRPS